MKFISSLLIIAIVVVQISTIFPIGSENDPSKAFVIELNNLFTNANHRIAEDNYCEDFRISCNSNGQIYGVELANHYMSGFPVGITAIKETLEKLAIMDANLRGNIPSQIYELTNLKYLNLEGNKFTGSLSNNIGKLKKLTILDLGQLGLNGSIPSSLYSLTQLEQLNLGGNRFNGRLSDDIKNLQNLVSLDVKGSILSGEIPDNLYLLTKLRRLDLALNKFGDSLGDNIGNLKELYYLNLSTSGVYGPIPGSFYSLVNLEQLDLANNGINGKLSSRIGKLTDLAHINLAHNRLSGVIPSEIGKLVRLEVLELQNNQFHGPIPDLNDLVRLIYLNISSKKYSLKANCDDHMLPPFTNEESCTIGSVDVPCNTITRCKYSVDPVLAKVPDPQESSSAGSMLYTPEFKTILSMVACAAVLQITLH